MLQKLRLLFEPLITAERHDRLKIFFLGGSFCFAIASYAILRSLKTAIFLGFVGVSYQPGAKYISIIATIPCMLFYSFLVNKLRRYQIIYFFLGTYAILSLIFAYLLCDPNYGISNTETSPWRLLGWAFYFFMDLFPILIVSSFWAFTNSINTTESAKKYYGFLVAFSKLGGIGAPILGWLMVNMTNWPDTVTIPTLVVFSAGFLFASALCIARLIKKVPGRYLHGYEAVYQVEKEKGKKHIKSGIWEGIRLMINQPYVFGLFGLVYCYEIISALIDYQMQVFMHIQYNNAIGDLSSFMFTYTATWQCLGLFIALFGTSTFLRIFDMQKCLMSVPLIVAVLLVALWAFPSLFAIFVVMVILRAVNYGFNHPIREILYIPTVKDIKFKSKVWIDSFGRNISKTSGATINWFSQGASYQSCLTTGCSFSFVIVGIWTLISFLVVKKYANIVQSGKVIGDNDE